MFSCRLGVSAKILSTKILSVLVLTQGEKAHLRCQHKNTCNYFGEAVLRASMPSVQGHNGSSCFLEFMSQITTVCV